MTKPLTLLTAFTLCAIVIVATVIFATVSADNPERDPQCVDRNGNDKVDIDELFDVIDAYFNGTSCLPSQSQPSATPQPGTPTPTPSPTPDIGQESLSQMVERLRPSVVKIVNDNDSGQGTGAIFKTDDQTAYIVTNYHVVDNTIKVKVTVEDTTVYDGTIVGVNRQRDLAVVRICCGTFTKAEFGDSNQLNIGDPVTAIGYALDSFQPTSLEEPARVIVPGVATVTRGIVSAFRYSTRMDAQIIQTDTPVNAGSSGGPLLNANGQIVGINTFSLVIFFSDGLHYAISEATVQELLPDLLVGKSPPQVVDREPIVLRDPLLAADAGHFHHNPSNNRFGIVSTGTGVQSDVLAGAQFVNPHDGQNHPFSYGFMFRQNPQSHLRVFVHSNGTLQVTLWTQDQGFQDIATFNVTELLQTGDSQYNSLDVITLGNVISLFLNTQIIADSDGNTAFPLGPNTGPGYSYIINGPVTGTERQEATTLYEDLYVSSLTYQLGTQDQALAELLDQATRQRSMGPPAEQLVPSQN